MLSKSKYTISENLFIQESKDYLYISIKNKNFRLKKSKNIRERIENCLTSIQKNIYDETDEIFVYLLKIKAIEEVVDKNTEAVYLYDFENDFCNKIIEKNYKNFIFDSKGLKVKIINGGNDLLIYKDNKYLDKINSVECNEIFLEYVLEVLKEKIMNFNFHHQLSTNAILVDLSEYSNNQKYISSESADTESNIFFMKELNKFYYNYDLFFPFIYLSYKNFLGEQLFVFGDSIEQCLYNLYVKLKNTHDTVYINPDYNKNILSIDIVHAAVMYYSKETQSHDYFDKFDNNGLLFEDVVRKNELLYENIFE